MTDPHEAYAFDNVSYAAEQDNPSPAISVSAGPEENAPTNHHRQPVQPVTEPKSDDRGAASAYATKPSPDTSLSSFFSYDQGRPPNTDNDTSARQQRLESPPIGLDQPQHRTPAVATFGSQPWVTPAGPYLDFAPQPVYEPTGELLDEQVQLFDQFDHPAVTVRPATAFAPKSLTPTSIGPVTNDQSAVNVFAQPSLPRSALKRKADLVDSPTSDQTGSKRLLSSNVPVKSRSVSFERMSSNQPRSPDEASTPSDHPQPPRGSQNASSAPGARRGRQFVASEQSSNASASSNPAATTRFNRGTRAPSGHPPSILPPEKVFPIQIGSELFRLSGASISSDAPSYFTQFFEEQIRQNEESGGVRTLYIDRDPSTFRDVARHLQGYHVKPVDGSHFVKLFADAQFYSLPRLIHQLFEAEIFIQIGERHFQIPKDIFSEPGNSPNFFSLGFAVFFSTPGEVFPGLDRRGLLRPPSITPPYVPGRSADIFAELLHLLRGYPLHIRNESHRAELLRDCRYFHLRGLEQKIIAHDISYNLERQKHEICLRLEDVKPSGVSFSRDEESNTKSTTGGWVYYARPFVDDSSYEMIVEIGGESTILNLNDMRADFHNLTKARISSLFQVVANKMNLPTNAPLGLIMLSGGQSRSASPGQTPLSEDRVKVRFEPATAITLNGESYEIDWDSTQGQIMAEGPPIAPTESESESDAMSDTTPAMSTSRAQSSTGAGQQRRGGGKQGQAGSSPTATRTAPRVTRIQTSQPSEIAHAAKKRKRQASLVEPKEWTIRTGQWRLRVQPNPQDSIRGGFEIVFMAVKIDAFSSENARNVRRAFLK